MGAMEPWGEVEIEPEVEGWLGALDAAGLAQAAHAIDLLESRGVLLGEPHTRQLDGKLRELRFTVAGEPTRISYFVATGRRIILLTVFTKTQDREPAEIERARRAMANCVEHGHTVDEEV